MSNNLEQANGIFLDAGAPEIVSAESIQGATLFRRQFYLDLDLVGAITYSLDSPASLISPDAIASAFDAIRVDRCQSLADRLKAEQEISDFEIYSELRHQLAVRVTPETPYGKVAAIWESVAMNKRHIANGLLDKSLPVKEALAKWISKSINRHL